jgi:hypothetical protein
MGCSARKPQVYANARHATDPGSRSEVCGMYGRPERPLRPLLRRNPHRPPAYLAAATPVERQRGCRSVRASQDLSGAN